MLNKQWKTLSLDTDSKQCYPLGLRQNTKAFVVPNLDGSNTRQVKVQVLIEVLISGGLAVDRLHFKKVENCSVDYTKQSDVLTQWPTCGSPRRRTRSASFRERPEAQSGELAIMARRLVINIVWLWMYLWEDVKLNRLILYEKFDIINLIWQKCCVNFC